MIKLDISDSSFNRKFSSIYELSILHRMDSFTFMLTDAQQRLVFLRDYLLEYSAEYPSQCQEQLQEIFEKDDVLSLGFRNQTLGLVTHRQTLIPNRLYNPQEKSVYLAHILPTLEGLETRSDDLPGFSAQNVFAFPEQLLHFYQKQIPSARLCQISSAFLQTRRLEAGTREKTRMHVHIWQGLIQVVLFVGRDLQMVNTFPYRSTKDFLYFTMLIYDQFALDPVENPLYLSGDIVEDSEIYRHLLRYIRRIEFLPPPPGFHTGILPAETPVHWYYDLFCLLHAF